MCLRGSGVCGKGGGVAKGAWQGGGSCRATLHSKCHCLQSSCVPMPFIQAFRFNPNILQCGRRNQRRTTKQDHNVDTECPLGYLIFVAQKMQHTRVFVPTLCLFTPRQFLRIDQIPFPCRTRRTWSIYAQTKHRSAIMATNW